MTLALPIIIAIASPLTSASDYVFAPPALTNRIQGILIGDAQSYGAMRYEDMAFLSEAYAEREALGVYNTQSDADFLARATNESYKVLSSPLISYPSLPTGHAVDDYLAPGVEPATHAVKIRSSAEGSFSWETNEVYRDEFRLSTNRYERPPLVISQSLTNGTLDVWTNLFSGSFASNIVERSGVVTNTVTIEDFCTTNGQVITVAESEMYQRQLLDDDFLLYSHRTISNRLELVRAIRMSVPVTALKTYTNNNATTSFYRNWDGRVTSTNSHSTSTGYSCEFFYSKTSEDEQELVDGEWKSTEGYPYNGSDYTSTVTEPDGYFVARTTRPTKLKVTYKTDTPRVSKANAFAFVTVTYHHRKESSASTADGAGRHYLEITNLTGMAMVPHGVVYRQNSEDQGIDFEVTISKSVYAQAAELTNVPFIQAMYTPDLPPVATPEWYMDGDSRRSSGKSQFASVTMSAYAELYLIIHINPTTKLPNWSEYQ